MECHQVILRELNDIPRVIRLRVVIFDAGAWLAQFQSNTSLITNGPLSLHLFTTGVIAVLVQSFLVVRYWKFTPTVCLLAHRIVPTIRRAQLGGSFSCAMVLAMFPAFKDREKVKIPAPIWLITEAVADLSIAAALLWQLLKARPTLVETRSVLDRLMMLTIQSGAATATVAAAALIAYLLDEEGNVTVGFAYTLGRMYILSMLANLNVRRSGKSSSVDSDGVSSTAGLGTLTIPLFIVTDDLGNSHFHHTVNIGPREDMITSNHAKSLGDDSRPAEIEMTASHSPRKHFCGGHLIPFLGSVCTLTLTLIPMVQSTRLQRERCPHIVEEIHHMLCALTSLTIHSDHIQAPKMLDQIVQYIGVLDPLGWIFGFGLRVDFAEENDLGSLMTQPSALSRTREPTTTTKFTYIHPGGCVPPALSLICT
ncbi:hypothetical protein K438DRAFT_1758109 [Mycena galopus ATCC 62051]|nr:hypothetical protein K438DRAFT_1758109 [Mycena galopus ATCC 62051]